MVTKTIILFDPTSKTRRKELRMAARPSNLEGKVVGFLWNNKPGGEVLLDRFAQLLDERFHLAKIVKHTKPYASSGASIDMLDSLSAECDLIITAMGDCGSCTSYVVHDAIELEKRGTPSVSVCSSEFVALGKAEVAVLGMANLPMVIVPHPIGGIDLKEVEKKADDAFEDMITALFVPQGESSEQTR